MTARGKRPLRFTRLELASWRNFDRIGVGLQGRAFLVGPNASGKSNLLDALRFLRDIVAVGGGLLEAVRRRGGVARLRRQASRRHELVGIKVTIGNDTSEAWLLGDRERLAQFLHVPINRIPVRPESVADPKRLLVDIARRSASRTIRQGMTPRPDSRRLVGPAYDGLLMNFVLDRETGWRPEVAATACDSLARCLRRLQELAPLCENSPTFPIVLGWGGIRS